MASMHAAPALLGVDQKELEAELARTRRKVDAWASSRQQLAADTQNRHFAAMQDQTGPRAPHGA
jgi:hypothetical protein